MKPEQVRMARNALRMSIRELASLANITHVTLNRFEVGKSGIQLSTAEALRKALESRGVQFLDTGQVALGVGVALRDSSEE